MKNILIKTNESSIIFYRKLIYAIYPHILIMDTSFELPAKRHFNVYICTVLRSIHAMKKCPGLLHQLKFRSAALICRKSLDNLVLFLNMCLIHMHFLQENALQCNMEIVQFSPKKVSRHAVMLPLRARATVRSTRFLHADAMENVTYTRTVPNCKPSSGVHLSCPIRLFGLLLDSQGLRDRIFFFSSDKQE